ncbi:E3 ubiquitin-protein ligase SGR9, amyloplastic-like [Fagus crenata]
MNSLILPVPHPILSHQPSHQNYIIAGLLELNLSLEIAQRVASFAVNLAYGCTGYSITAVVELLCVEEVDERLLFESLNEEELLNGGIGDQNELSTEVGASTSAIENLVKKGGFVCNCKSQESSDMGTCTICLEDFSSSEAEEDEKLIRMDCYHIFHQSCLLPWLQKQASCPNCRRELIED